jgi:hypothetical protein
MVRPARADAPHITTPANPTTSRTVQKARAPIRAPPGRMRRRCYEDRDPSPTPAGTSLRLLHFLRAGRPFRRGGDDMPINVGLAPDPSAHSIM